MNDSELQQLLLSADPPARVRNDIAGGAMREFRRRAQVRRAGIAGAVAAVVLVGLQLLRRDDAHVSPPVAVVKPAATDIDSAVRESTLLALKKIERARVRPAVHKPVLINSEREQASAVLLCTAMRDSQRESYELVAQLFPDTQAGTVAANRLK